MSLETRLERIPTMIFEDYGFMALKIADEIANIIAYNNRQGKKTVLGLATGSTPLELYRELGRRCKEEHLDFSNVVTFNLDEYYPISPRAEQSYVRFMWENLLKHINIKPENVHIPFGLWRRQDIKKECRKYEEEIAKAGGIDLQILGIGKTGHIGFNEPGSSRDSRTRLIVLDEITKRDAASDFYGIDNVPDEAITMGVATIMDAKRVILMATGEHKAPIIRRAVEGPPTEGIAATYLQQHNNAAVYVDKGASLELTRVKTLWMVRPINWSHNSMLEKAVIWLSNKQEKSVYQLTRDDYMDTGNGLARLVMHYERKDLTVDNINKKVAEIIDKKTKVVLPKRKKVWVYSSHPDDDVICCSATIKKLVDLGNRVRCVYATSGNTAVFDEDVIRSIYAQESRRGKLTKAEKAILKDLARKQPAEADTEKVFRYKGHMREGEARAAIGLLGVEDYHFLHLPFYETRTVQKDPISERDIRIVYEKLIKDKPDIIFAPGELADPHGTHGMAMQALVGALEIYCKRTKRDPELWLYKGAWVDYRIDEANTLIPFSAYEQELKTRAIRAHKTQDPALFPGQSDDPFYLRAIKRNCGNADDIDRAGLGRYHAVEAYQRMRFNEYKKRFV